MILKDVDPVSSADPKLKAGHRAEKQMAFYLSRAFASDADVMVINGLRLQLGEEIAQFDHLIFSRFGFVIVESKSVSTRVRINEHGEWSRQIGNRWRGMASPIEQGRLQSDLLRALLNQHAEILVRTPKIASLLGQRYGFRNAPIEVVVAISVDGDIERCTKDELPVRKADLVAAYVSDRLKALSKSTLLSDPWSLTRESLVRVREFLLESHVPALIRSEEVVSSAAARNANPRSSQKETPEPTVARSRQEATHAGPAPAEADLSCGACGNERTVVRVGRYGPYAQCDCGKNTPLKQRLGDRFKVAKKGDHYVVVAKNDSGTSSRTALRQA